MIHTKIFVFLIDPIQKFFYDKNRIKNDITTPLSELFSLTKKAPPFGSAFLLISL